MWKYAPIKNSTEESLISDIRTTSNIVTGISNIQIVRSLDRDAADVMKRVPGVTVLNNFVLVRGMDPRYNVTYLNDMLVPSTESDSRAFSFNLIPSGLIDDIKIFKLPSPELPGGFGGGVIKINTKRNQTARRIQVDMSTQYRTGSASMNDYYGASNTSSKDWMASGLKDRALPAKFYDKNYTLPSLEQYPQERMAAIRSLPRVNQLVKTHYGLDKRFSLNYYDSWKLGTVRLNNLTAIGYTAQGDNDSRTHAERGTGGWAHDSEGKPTVFVPEFQSIDSVYTQNVRLSLLESVGVTLNEHHRFSLNVFANRNAEDNTLLTAESRGEDLAGRLVAGMPAPARKVGFEYRVRDLLSAQLSGDHDLGEKHHIHWYGGRTQQIEQIPDWQIYSFYKDVNGYTLDISANTNVALNIPRQRYYTKETVDLGGVDYSFDIVPMFTLKAGFMLQNSKRNFDNFVYTYVVPPVANNVTDVYTNNYQPWFHVQDIFTDQNFRDDGTGFNLLISPSAGSYSFEQNISAGYLAGRVKLLQEKIEVYGGMRYENEYAQLFDGDGKAVSGYQELESVIDPVTGQPTSQLVFKDIPGPDYEYFLPSLNVTWNINEKHKLRGGYGRTLDRPAFRERSNASYYSFRDRVNYSGNIRLKNARLDNYDLRWEWYPTTSEFIAFGTYYKFIQNPIEVVEYGASSYSRLNRSWENKYWAELYGIELEVRKNLGFIPLRYAEQFSVIINASYMHTNLREDIDLNNGQALDARPTRPLTGSSPYVANVNLYYEHPKIKTVVTASYNYIGSRIIATAVGFVGNLHEKEQHLLDLVVIQPIGKYVRVKAGVQNLLNKDIIRWRDGNYDGEYHPGVLKPANELIDPQFADRADHEADRWSPGSYYSIGVTLTF